MFGSATRSFATERARIGRLEADQAITEPRIVTLIGGQDDESPTAVSCTIAADTSNYKVAARGWQMTASGAVTAQLRLDPVATDVPATFPVAAGVGAWVYIPDSTKITSVTLGIYSDVGITV